MRVVDVLIGGVGAAVVEVGDFVGAVARYPQRRPLLVGIDARHNFHGDALDVRTLGQDRLGILQRERLAVALFRAHAPDADGNVPAEDEERVGAVVVQIALDVAADADQHRGDEDHGGDANHHAQHGQKGARLVLAHRLQRHPRIYAKVHPIRKASG